MKRWIPWTLAVLLLLVLAGSLGRTLSIRKQQAALGAAAALLRPSAIELVPSDTVRAEIQELTLAIPLSGTLRATHSAMVKARVSGELQGLAVREGDTVKAGQILAKIDATEYLARQRQTQQQADAAKAQVEITQRQFDNNRALVDQGFISQTALDNSQANLNATQATYQAALAAVELTRKSLEDTVLRSPMEGQIAQRLAQPGERVNIDTRVVEVVDVRHMEMEAALAAADSLEVRVGQTASLAIEGMPGAVAAQVVRISPSTQAGSRSVLAYLGIDNPGGLRNGLFAQGQLDTGRLRTLAIPLDAVRTDKPQPYAQIVQNNSVVDAPLVLGARGQIAGETMVAVTGVSEGATVLRGSVGSLREGTQVKITAPALQPERQPTPATP